MKHQCTVIWSKETIHCLAPSFLHSKASFILQALYIASCHQLWSNQLTFQSKESIPWPFRCLPRYFDTESFLHFHLLNMWDWNQSLWTEDAGNKADYDSIVPQFCLESSYTKNMQIVHFQLFHSHGKQSKDWTQSFVFFGTLHHSLCSCSDHASY